MRDVEAVLRGYLWNRPDKEAWMYRALAMAIRINQGLARRREDRR